MGRPRRALGQRVEGFALDRADGNAWQEFAHGTGIGNCRLVRTSPITAARVRLRIINAPVYPAISEMGVFLEPASAE